ncbi:MAG: hypothetical protein ACRDK5_03645 [Solirubrobacterales bacterium]
MSKQTEEHQGEPEPGDSTSRARGNGHVAHDDGPGSETERFRALVDVTHNESVTGESGVPRKLRDHEQRCQEELLDEFS